MEGRSIQLEFLGHTVVLAMSLPMMLQNGEMTLILPPTMKGCLVDGALVLVPVVETGGEMMASETVNGAREVVMMMVLGMILPVAGVAPKLLTVVATMEFGKLAETMQVDMGVMVVDVIMDLEDVDADVGVVVPVVGVAMAQKRVKMEAILVAMREVGILVETM